MSFARSRTTAGIAANDTHDVDWGELWLIRAGQHLWTLWKAENRGKTVPPDESRALWEAIETIWEVKAAYRQDVQARRKQESAEMAARMRGKP